MNGHDRVFDPLELLESRLSFGLDSVEFFAKPAGARLLMSPRYPAHQVRFGEFGDPLLAGRVGESEGSYRMKEIRSRKKGGEKPEAVRLTVPGDLPRGVMNRSQRIACGASGAGREKR